MNKGSNKAEIKNLDKASKLQSILQCPECQLVYSKPQILNCQHTFCQNCIAGLKVKMRREVKCSLCEEVTSFGDIKRDINKEQLVEVCRVPPDETRLSRDSGNEEDITTGSMGGDIVTPRNIPKLNFSIAAEQVALYLTNMYLKSFQQTKTITTNH